MLCGCKDAKEQALEELHRRSIQGNPAALATAVEQQDRMVIGFLSIAGVKAALPEAGKPSVLHLAAARKDWPLVLSLVDFCGAPILNHPGPQDQVILEQAVSAGEFALARNLVAAGAKPEPAACGVDVMRSFTASTAS